MNPRDANRVRKIMALLRSTPTSLQVEAIDPVQGEYTVCAVGRREFGPLRRIRPLCSTPDPRVADLTSDLSRALIREAYGLEYRPYAIACYGSDGTRLWVKHCSRRGRTDEGERRSSGKSRNEEESLYRRIADAWASWEYEDCPESGWFASAAAERRCVGSLLADLIADHRPNHAAVSDAELDHAHAVLAEYGEHFPFRPCYRRPDVPSTSPETPCPELLSVTNRLPKSVDWRVKHTVARGAMTYRMERIRCAAKSAGIE
jgi:hypothetical protein